MAELHGLQIEVTDHWNKSWDDPPKWCHSFFRHVSYLFVPTASLFPFVQMQTKTHESHDPHHYLMGDDFSPVGWVV